ncbi:ribonuclease H-like domain-containing protein [Lyophyllum atratum]|nr:ribonuclease H-like domain-containing protein [Lyophyllum atratum]
MPTTPLLNPYSWRTIHPDATIHYIRDPDDADTLVDTLSGPVGFDLEWKPTFTNNTPENPVALVQLANQDTILLIQISAMQEFPAKLKDFLESPDFVKAGVAIQNDVKKLYRDCGVSTRNCVDLSLLARCADNAQWKGKYSSPLGLARLIEAYENLTLPKGRISRSNWEDAGNDAHAGFVLHQRLSSMADAMDNIPKTVYYTFDAVRGRLCEPTGMHWNCYNPDYDPGPPPPPKPAKEPTARDLRRAAARAFSTTTTPGPGLVPNHLVVAPRTPPGRYFPHQDPAAPRYLPSSKYPTETSSTLPMPAWPLQRRRRPPFSTPINQGSSMSNLSPPPISGSLSSYSGLVLAETAHPSAKAAPLPRRDPMASAQLFLVDMRFFIIIACAHRPNCSDAPADSARIAGPVLNGILELCTPAISPTQRKTLTRLGTTIGLVFLNIVQTCEDLPGAILHATVLAMLDGASSRILPVMTSFPTQLF